MNCDIARATRLKNLKKIRKLERDILSQELLQPETERGRETLRLWLDEKLTELKTLRRETYELRHHQGQ